VPVQQPQAPESVAGLLARLKRAAEAAGTTQQAQVPRPASNLPTPAPQPQEQKPVRTWPGFFARNLGSLAGGIYAANRFGGTKLPQVLRAEALGRMAGSSAVAGAEQLVAGRSLSDAGREAAREVITTGVRNATIPHATQTGHELGSLFGHYRGLSPRASGTAANIGSEVGTVGGYALGHDTGRSIADWLIREPATKSAEADPKEKAEEPKSKAEESKPAKPVRTGLGYLARGLSGYAGGRLAETRLGGNKLPQQLAAYMGGRMAGSSTAAGAEQLLAGRDAGAAGREAIRDAVGTLGARSGRAFGSAGGQRRSCEGKARRGRQGRAWPSGRRGRRGQARHRRGLVWRGVAGRVTLGKVRGVGRGRPGPARRMGRGVTMRGRHGWQGVHGPDAAGQAWRGTVWPRGAGQAWMDGSAWRGYEARQAWRGWPGGAWQAGREEAGWTGRQGSERRGSARQARRGMVGGAVVGRGRHGQVGCGVARFGLAGEARQGEDG
jgi:hypothetical protein